MCIEEHPFPEVLAEPDYRVFSPELENDESVVYRATRSEYLASIKANGGFPFTGPGGGISFAEKSYESVRHWCNVRGDSEEGVIFAVRSKPAFPFVKEGPHLHLFNRDPGAQPEILAYSIIRASFRFV
jgi:hypothetical protein